MKMAISTKSRSLLITTFAYIYLPVMIFLFGFVRWYILMPSLAVVFFFGYKIYKDYLEDYKDSDILDVSIKLPILAVVVLIITGVCILIGFGAIFPQSGDWYKHNAVLRDLVIRSWPVYYPTDDPSMLTYYLGQYMVPAVIGRIFGRSFDVASAAMAVWGVFGLVLAYLHLIRIVKADSALKQLVTVFVMFFFCGGLVLAQVVLQGIYGDDMFSMGSYHWILVRNVMIQYRSNLIMLRWVYPQVIVPWIVTILLMEHRKRVEDYVLLIVSTILFGSFSFAALVVMGLVFGIEHLLKRELTIKERLLKLFSISNILSGLTLGLIFFFYFLGNLQVTKPYYSSFRFQNYFEDKTLPVYFVFCFFMFGIYAICTWKEHKKDIVFYVNVAILLILPFLRMGLCNDVVMSGSIPSLWILMIFCLQLLLSKDNAEAGIRKGIILSLMIIGLWYPSLELRDNIVGNHKGSDIYDGYKTMMKFSDRSASYDVSEDLIYNYYTYDLEGKVFYEAIARYKMAK